MERIVVKPRLFRSVGFVLLALVFGSWLGLDPLGAKIAGGILGIGFLVLAVASARRRIFVDGAAIERTGFRSARIPWEDVAAYAYFTARFGEVTTSQPKDVTKAFCGLRVVAKDGKKIVIDHRWRRPQPAVWHAVAELQPRLRTAGLRDFPPFSFGETALRHDKKGGIDYGDIEKVVVSADQLMVRKKGQTIGFASVELKYVSNNLLFLEALVEHDVTVLFGGGQLIPTSVVDRLRETASHRRLGGG